MKNENSKLLELKEKYREHLKSLESNQLTIFDNLPRDVYLGRTIEIEGFLIEIERLLKT